MPPKKNMEENTLIDDPIDTITFQDIKHLVYYDESNNKYWAFLDNKWSSYNVDRFKEIAHEEWFWRLRPRTKDGEEQSPMSCMMGHISRVNRISGTVCLPHDKREIVVFGGKKYLNDSTFELLEAKEGDWGLIKEFFMKRFEPEQMDALFSWIKVYLDSCRRGEPRPGHALWIGGHKCRGKNFLTTFILGRMFGGYRDGTDLLLNGAQFTADLLSSPILTANDARPSDNKQRHSFTNRVKSFIANPEKSFHKKFGASVCIESHVRLVCTMNLDVESIGLLPNINDGDHDSMKDKVMFLKMNETSPALKIDPREAWGIYGDALKAFVWYLENEFVIPESLAGAPRFGCRSYQHADLLQESKQLSNEHNVEDALVGWWGGENLKTAKFYSTFDLIKGIAETTGSTFYKNCSPTALSRMIIKAQQAGGLKWVTRYKTKYERGWLIESPPKLDD